MKNSKTLMSWNPRSDKILEDPASGYTTLLENCPVHYSKDFDPPFFTISRFTDVDRVLRDTKTFSSEHGQGPRFSEPQGMLCDPPKHTHMRRIVQKAFTPRAMHNLTPQINATIESLLKTISNGSAQFDLHDDYAFPLPVLIIAGMLGIPTKDLDQFKKWSDMQVAAMGSKDPDLFAGEQKDFFSYMYDHWMMRKSEIEMKKNPPKDLLTVIAEAKNPDGSPISESDALSMLTQLLVGGNETTTSLITNSIWRLLQDRTQWKQLIDDPTLAPNAIEESLRYDPPVLGLYRNTTKTVTLHGIKIPKGSKVFINYAAANRDPEAFDDPNRFNIKRKPKRHMSFGVGVHFCLGAPMARLESELALTALAENLPDLQLLGDGKRITPFFLWGRSKLPLSFRNRQEK